MLKLSAIDIKQNPQYIVPILMILIIGGLVIHQLIGTEAAAPYARVTADTGTLSALAQKQSCTGSTSGNCVSFGSTSTSSNVETIISSGQPAAAGKLSTRLNWTK